MKNIISISVILILGWLMLGCENIQNTENLYPPAIKYNDTIYLGEGYTINKIPNGFVKVGEVKPVGRLNKLPMQNFESNFPYNNGVIYENKEIEGRIYLEFIDTNSRVVYELFKADKYKKE